MSATHSSSPLTHLSNNIKPHPNEALLRLRSSSLALFSIFLTTNLLPFPSPIQAWKIVFSGHPAGGPIWWGLCCAEIALLSLLLLNTLQSIYAIKYPRAPLPIPPSSAKRLKIASTPAPKPKKRLSTLSSNTSPQPQKSFSSSYASSPLSTPSRTLNYTVPSPFNQSFSSSFNSSFGTGNISSANSSTGLNNSPLAAYRGKHARPVGRAFDGSFLAGLADGVSDGE